MLDRRTGRPIPRLRIVGEDGAPLGGKDLEMRPGPGASKRAKARFAERAAAAQGVAAQAERQKRGG